MNLDMTSPVHLTPVAAANVVIEAIVKMAGEGRPLMKRVLPDSDVHWWEHYPDDDARDSETRSRWYYHVHPPGSRSKDEHGHFHLFLHRTQMDKAAEPMAQPELGDEAPALMTHIAGLAIDHNGIPIRWFTVNRWVTDEFMYPAAVMMAHLDRYNVDNTEEDPTVNCFLTAMVALYRNELAQILSERDAKLIEIGAGPDNLDMYETENEVLSTCAIDLDAKMEELGIA
jgi:hypothetical protein